MSALNRPDNFAGRVNYAAALIIRRGEATRSFDNCFENYDGDVVAVALIRRARKNPNLAANLPRYVNVQLCEQNAAEHANVPTRKLGELAATMRAKAKARNEKEAAERDAQKAAEVQAAIDAGYTIEPSAEPHHWTAKRPDGSVIASNYFWPDAAWHFAYCDLERQAEAAA